MTIAEEFATYSAALTYEDLPEEVVDHAKKLLVDILGNAVGGYEWMDSGETFVGAARRLDGDRDGGVRLFATGDRLSSPLASFANGSLAHSLDYDNHHAKGVVHIGSSAIPAALAAAEEADADGKALLTAIVAGYDVTARIGMALNPFSSHNLGFHPTGVAGVFGATAAVGKLHGFDAEDFENAFGFNGSQASGSMQYDLNGAWNKRAHPGLAAHSAFIAAAVVEEGLLGAAAPIEGEDGLLQAYSSDPKPERATARLGEEFELANTAIKPYPLCRYTHLAIDLTLGLVSEEGITPEQVQSVTVEMPTYGVNLVGSPIEAKRHPQGPVDAQFSMPFAVALALTRGTVNLQTFSDALESGPDEFQQLMDRTTVRAAEDIDAKHPEKWPARVILETTTDTYEHYGEQTTGEPDKPMSWEDLSAKFADLTPSMEADTRQRVVDVTRDIENHPVSDLVDPF